MRNVKCSYCEEYRNEWCEKVVDSPHPDILRDCQYFHEAKTRWIPVTERLPEEEDEYLVTIDGNRYYATTSYWSKGYYTAGWQWNDDNVIAWMPLPEPYKRGQDG